MSEHDYHALDASLIEISRKVDRLTALIDGSGTDAPGLIGRVAIIERLLYGKDQNEGIVQKVAILWRSQIWILCTLSAIAGFLLRELVRIVWKI